MEGESEDAPSAALENSLRWLWDNAQAVAARYAGPAGEELMRQQGGAPGEPRRAGKRASAGHVPTPAGTHRPQRNRREQGGSRRPTLALRRHGGRLGPPGNGHLRRGRTSMSTETVNRGGVGSE